MQWGGDPMLDLYLNISLFSISWAVLLADLLKWTYLGHVDASIWVVDDCSELKPFPVVTSSQI